MRVAYNAALLGGYFSGVEITISTLAGMLSRRLGRDLHVFVGARARDSHPFPEATVHSANFAPGSRVARIAWEHLVLPGRARSLGCELLHCPGYIAPCNSPCPTVVTIHDLTVFLRPELCRISNRLYYRMLLGRSARNAAQMIVPSKIVKDQLIELFSVDAARINVIPFAASPIFKKVEDQNLLDHVRNKYGLPEKFILFASNHEPKKNIPGILRTFAEFRNKVEGYKLVLAGRKAWGTEEADALIRRLGLGEELIAPGYVPVADLSALYSLADIFFFPSLDEGFGIPVLEAMACGVPVVCSDRGALPETTAGAAVCVPPTDVDGMARALANFAEDKALRKTFIQKGFERAASLTWEKTADTTLEVYKKALGLKGWVGG